jgi:hypothetical protein
MTTEQVPRRQHGRERRTPQCGSEPADRKRTRASLSTTRTAAAVILIGFALADCSTRFELDSLYVTPGKYDYLRCPDIVARIRGSQARQRDLADVMQRASQDAAGPVVNALVYSTDLAQARADEKELRATAQEKKCEVDPPKPPEQRPADPRPARP